MKRNGSCLVSYSSSEEDEPKIEQKPKKRKLPSLSSSLTVAAPKDNPTLHQGRIRTKPHVEGQFVAHIYVSLKVGTHSPLSGLTNDVLDSSKKAVPILEEIGIEGGKKERELHISLSRPTYLRAHQREDLQRAVKNVAGQHRPFQASFAMFSELTNDERTRTFLTMEVGAGHLELRALADALTPALQAIRQKEFYSDPRFHSSIAWALLDSSSAIRIQRDKHSMDRSPAPDDTNIVPSSPVPPIFRTIPEFPKNLISALNQDYGPRLASTKVGLFDVEEICIKIGKEIHSWRLTGSHT